MSEATRACKVRREKTELLDHEACLVHKESLARQANEELLAQLDLKAHKDNVAYQELKDYQALMELPDLKASILIN